MFEGIKYNKIILFFNTRTGKNLKRQVVMVSTSIHKHTFQSEVNRLVNSESVYHSPVQSCSISCDLLFILQKRLVLLYESTYPNMECVHVKNAVLVSSELLPLENVQIKLTTFSQENFLHRCN